MDAVVSGRQWRLKDKDAYKNNKCSQTPGDRQHRIQFVVARGVSLWGTHWATPSRVISTLPMKIANAGGKFAGIVSVRQPRM